MTKTCNSCEGRGWHADPFNNFGPKTCSKCRGKGEIKQETAEQKARRLARKQAQERSHFLIFIADFKASGQTREVWNGNGWKHCTETDWTAA